MKKSKDLELLRESIKHWCLDIRRPLLKGGEITDMFEWAIKGGTVEMFSENCALCQEYGLACAGCPLHETNNTCSDKGSAYREFYKNTDIKSANNMIADLVKTYWTTMSRGKL